MKPKHFRQFLVAVATAFCGLAFAAERSDPYTWMEEIEGARALAWAKAENERSLKVLEADPQFAGLHADALAIVNAKDRIPVVRFAGHDELRNFWQDTDHVRGIWRRTTLDSYRSESPAWELLLDVDELAKAENANWVWSGVDCLPPEDRLCLVSLSDAGKDAVTVREFDTHERKFVEDGFALPEGKHRVAWRDADTVLIGTEWEPGQLTTSGYPYIIKALKRGQALTAAQELFRGDAKDGGYGVDPAVLRDADGAVQAVLASRPLDTFTTEYYFIGGDRPVKLPLPLQATVQTYVAGKLVFTLEENWPARNLKEGDLAAYDLAALKADPERAVPQLVLRPGPREAIEEVSSTRNRLVVALYDNVKGAIIVFEPKGDGWSRSKLEQLPGNSSVGVVTASDRSDQLIASVAGFLTPTTHWLADSATGRAVRLKALAPRFDASNLQVDQYEATSKDGTKVPYFVVRPKGVDLVGAAPTLLYAYGGFQVSMTPWYSGVVGKLWLERGGTFVVANIRGGGEFGPAWHNAGLKENRQKVYDDFFAVSEDLIARKITSARRLGIMGGSNGGLLMGVAMTQRPELYRAIVIQVPLFDMIRYTQIGAGASWVGEYGDPAIPAERAVIEKYSPYQKLQAGRQYPEVFIETSTADDRVHPAHARKAAARLKELGYPYLYYENMEGGHSAGANLNQVALTNALEYTYLSRRLMGCGCGPDD
ncbi:MAG: prolyl oligopeptidase family serine peptidase [Steroidobacteraceae bacterium]